MTSFLRGATPPKKNPGSAPALLSDIEDNECIFSYFSNHCSIYKMLNMLPRICSSLFSAKVPAFRRSQKRDEKSEISPER